MQASFGDSDSQLVRLVPRGGATSGRTNECMPHGALVSYMIVREARLYRAAGTAGRPPLLKAKKPKRLVGAARVR